MALPPPEPESPSVPFPIDGRLDEKPDYSKHMFEFSDSAPTSTYKPHTPEPPPEIKTPPNSLHYSSRKFPALPAVVIVSKTK